MSFTRKFASVVALAVFSSAPADTIHVDDDNCPGPGDGSALDPYCFIQTAIDAVVDRDEIVVAPGTYFETIDFLGKAITLRSSDCAEATIIDGTGFFHVVRCVNHERSDTVLDGFTITGGNAGGTFPDNLGGGMYSYDSDPTVRNCIFSGNSAVNGGGMYNIFSSPVLTNCSFLGNTVFDIGGGIRNVNGGATVINCTFIDNVAGTFGGAIANHNVSLSMVINCLFRSNTGGFGGAMVNSDSSPTVINCTFSGNAAESGGGLYSTNGSHPMLANCILWGDRPDEIFFPMTTVAYSDVQGGWSGTGNIDADPLFVDPDSGDFRLSPGSPCIDASDNSAYDSFPPPWLELDPITTDLDGNPRFLEIPETPDTGNGVLPIVDMGAYESLGGGCLAVTSQDVACRADSTTFTVNVEGLSTCTGGATQVTFTGSGGNAGEELCFTVLVGDGGFCCSTEICVTVPDCSGTGDVACPADLDGDGMVGGTDLLSVLGSWGGSGGDTNGDGTTDIVDLLAVVGGWGACL